MTKEEALTAIENYPVFNWYENKANVFGLFLAFDARTKHMEKVFRDKYTAMICVGEKNYFAVYMNKEDNDRIAHIILKRIENSKEWFTNACQEIYRRADELITFSRELKDIDYRKKTDKEVSKLYLTFVMLFENMRVYSSIPTMLEHGTPILTKKLKEEIAKRVLAEKRNEVFGALTTPEKISYLLEEELKRLKIAQEIKKGKKINTKEIQGLIGDHTKTWCWKEYMFEGIPLSENDFQRAIEEDIKQDPEKQIADIEKKRETIRKKQKECGEKYGLPKEVQELAKVSREIVYLKYFRKGRFAESYYCVEFLLREIGRRLDLTLQDVQAMVDYEVVDALENKVINKETIRKRKTWCAFVSYKGKCYGLEKEEIETFLNNNKQIEQTTNTIQGTVACTGKIIGTVRVINDKEEMHKMREGNILVSIMTNPNMFSAMKKAGAIITDVGGLSCHAAIVARELNIPCIVGTKNATTLLKDGMLVEVDADVGTVTII